MKNSSIQRAFTLIELLVVIAIIAILAAILFPVFAQAKAAAKKTQSLSNVKQLNLGIMMYTNDSDDMLPMAQYQNPEWISWIRVTDPYVKSGSSTETRHGDTGVYWGIAGLWRAPGDPTRQENSSYALHQDLVRDGTAPWNSNPPHVFSTTAIDNGSEKVLMIEKGINKGAAAWLTFAAWEWDWTPGVNYNRTNNTAGSDNSQVSVQKGKGDCDFTYNINDTDSTSTTWAQCGMLPRYRYNLSTPVTFLDGHAKTFNRVQNDTSLKWFKYIYIPEASQYDASWYPY